MTKPLNDWPAVHDHAAGLPGTTQGTYYGSPSIMAAKSNRPVVTASREEDSFVLHIDLNHKAMLMDLHSDRFWETPHYSGYPALLVRFGPADPVAEWIERALELAAARPRRKAK